MQTSQKETSLFLTTIQQCISKLPFNTFYSLTLFLKLVIKRQIASLIQVYVCTDNGIMALCVSLDGNLMKMYFDNRYLSSVKQEAMIGSLGGSHMYTATVML